MTNRREFLAAVAAGIGVMPVRGMPTVTARPTVFHRHPDGQTTLVRFRVSEVGVPAGRLRLFDRANRLVGTAGLLRRGDELVGDLWLPLAGETRVRSELEMPGTRRPIRTRHTLSPQPRWTVYWFSSVDPLRLSDQLERVPGITRGGASALLIQAGVRANPVARAVDASDHIELLRTALPATRVARAFGIPVSRVALSDNAQPGSPLAAALAGSGVDRVLSPRDVAAASAVGIDNGTGALTAGIEAWLARLDAGDTAVTVIVGDDIEVAVRALATVEQWNQRYAYPHIEIGEPTGPVATVASVPTSVTASAAVASVSVLRSDIDDRLRERAHRARERFAPLASLIAPADPTLEGIARRFAFPVSGTLVFNASPFGRSDVVSMPGGEHRLITDVPGLGYAFIPDAGSSTPRAEQIAHRGDPLVGAVFRLALDRHTGSIASLTVAADERQLLAPENAGNVLAGGRANAISRERLPGIGERLVVRRSSSQGPVVTTMTLYDALPWLDIENVATTSGPATYTFAFAEPVSEFAWEVPGGIERAAQQRSFLPVRWLSISLSRGTVLIAAPGLAAAAMDERGRLTLTAPPGRTHIRIAYRDFLMRDDPARLGWSTEPMIALATPGTGGVELPTFARMIEVRDPGVAIVGLKPADDGVGVIAYVQDLLGIPRPVQLAPGLLAFDEASQTDYTERDVSAVPIGADGAVSVRLDASGFTAIRLLGIHLAG